MATQSDLPADNKAGHRSIGVGSDDELMTTKQLMEYLQLSRTKIWELVNKENLPAFKIGGDYRYRRSEVDEWMEKYRVHKGKA